MKYFKLLILPIWLFIRRINRFNRILGIGNSLQLAFAIGRKNVLKVKLSSFNHVLSLRCDASDINCMEKVLIDREYETPFPIDARVIIDAGANIGMATVFYAYKYPRAKILSIEPELSNFRILKENCFGLSNVILINAALWNKNCSLAIKDKNSEKWSFSVDELTSDLDTHTQNTPAVTIDSLIQDYKIDKIDILKLDIEGAERELFNNDATWLDSVGQLVIELHDRYIPGCARALYQAVNRYPFIQEIRGENIFIQLRD
jgi:FkbM family methyltransferase